MQDHDVKGEPRGAPAGDGVAGEGAAEGSTAGAPEVPAPGARPRSRRGSRGGQRRRTAKAPVEGADAATTGPTEQPAGREGGAEPKKGRAPRPRRKTSSGEGATTPLPPVAGEALAAGDPSDAGAASPEKKRAGAARRPRRGRKPAEPVTEGAGDAAAAHVPEGPAPKHRRSRAKSAANQDALAKSAADADPAGAPMTEGGVPPAPKAGAPSDDAEGGGAAEAAKRRRRGSRGGRRVRAREARRAAAEAEGQGGEARTAAVGALADTGAAPATEDTIPDTPPLGAHAGDAAALAVADAKPAGRRRGRRGGRRKGAAEAEAERPGGAPEAGGETTADVAEPAAAGPATDVGAEEGATGTKRSRRGGRRGKRTAADGAEPRSAAAAVETGRKAAPGEPGEAAGPPAAADEGEKAKKSRGRDRRRPKAIVRSENLTGADAGAVEGPALTTGRRPEVAVEVPKRKLILVTQDPSELRVALVEDGRLAEIYFERPEKRSYLGDIYRGKVENVLAGIDAAFVDFGLDKNGFLYVDEVRTGENDRRGRRIGDVLKQGQDVVVQVMKDPMGHKGARLTMHISLAGRYVVYVPGGSGVGVSRRLGQGERERLRELCKQLRVKNAGLIVRTAAEGEGLEEIRRDVQVLSRLWSRLKKKAETAPIPGLIHQEVDIALEVTRDLFNESVESLVVDDAKRHKAIVSFLDKVAPELVSRVRLHTGAEPLFEAYGIEQQISRALERRVPLPSGGNIVIDHTEALTVIDVNSGRYTSGRGLEDTILKTNLEAAREVVRELRLRDIGGIIIIDFIDMSHVKNRETVLATLEAELDTDRTKTYVVELSPLGLVEMTRQNTTDGARGILTRTCTSCQGKARTLSEETVALGVERRLRVHARKSGAKAYLVELSAGVAERLAASGRLKALEKETGRRIFLEASSGVAVDSFRILAEGSAEQVQAQRVPVREGQEVEVELEFALTYSPRDAVGYVDGYMIIVEGGRAFLGERRKARVTSTSRTGASAILTGGKGGGS